MPRGTSFHEKKSFKYLQRLHRENTDLDVNNLENSLNDEDSKDAFGVDVENFEYCKLNPSRSTQ